MSRNTLRLALPVLLAASGLLFAAPPTPEAAKPAPLLQAKATVQDLIFFTADGPVRVRLATLNGRSTTIPWQSALDGLFAHCDRNGDGLLEANERTLVQNYGQQFGRFSIVDINGTVNAAPQMPALVFSETNGKVDKNSFRAGFSLAGLGPVSVTPVAPRADSAAMTDALFKRFDADGDGKLSVAELKEARSRMAALDIDEDEIITSDELLGRMNAQFGYTVQVFDSIIGSVRQPAAPQIADLMIVPVNHAASVKDVLGARDKNKDGALSAAELGCEPKVIAGLDADGDGRLDTDELAAWLRRAPDLELAVELTGSPNAANWLELAPFLSPSAPPFNLDGTTSTLQPESDVGPLKLIGKGRLNDRTKRKPDGSYNMDLRDARFHFSADSSTGNTTRQQWKTTADQFRTAFDKLAGKKDEVTRQKLSENPETAGYMSLFDFADRNGDGKLTRVERDKAIRVGESLVNCRVAIFVTDRGRGLFELLDRDGDGRLTPRELNAAVALVAALDRDGDGKIARSELPRGYSIDAKLASVDVLNTSFGFGDSVVFLSGYSGTTVTRLVSADAPEWFKSLDRNGDGDVSAREFNGPPSLFQRIDADGDGLISAEEARAHEKAMKK